MRVELTPLLAIAGSLLISMSCGTSGTGAAGSGGGGSAGGGASGGGSGGAGGEGGVETAPIAGLWEGESRGLRVCFFIAEDGSELTSSSECSLDTASSGEENSYDLEVEAIGRDENGQPCGFVLSAGLSVPIDEPTGAFSASFTEPETGAELAFSGELTGLDASGVAARSEGGSRCTVGWAASRAAPCDADAVDACLDLQNCCRAILVNPVFFQSCDSVVRRCDEVECRRLRAGYSQCDVLDL